MRMSDLSSDVCSSDLAGSGVLVVLAQRALFLSRPIPFLRRLALVVRLLALGQRQFGLDLVALPVQRRGHEGVAVALDAANQLVALAPVPQQPAGAAVVGDDVAGGGDQRRDLGAEQEQLAEALDRERQTAGGGKEGADVVVTGGRGGETEKIK